jgi:hypothetical protein
MYGAIICWHCEGVIDWPEFDSRQGL